MFNRLLPQRLDESGPGSKVVLWLFGVVVFMKSMQSLAIIFNGYTTVRDADGIPLDTYPREAAQTMLAVFALASLWRLTFCLVGLVVLVRYRRLIPLMFALFALNYLGGELILRFVPLIRTGTPPGPIVNLVIFALMVIGLALSLRDGSGEAGMRG